MSKGLVVSLCDYTGVMVAPWSQAGYECVCVDTRHEGSERREGRIQYVCGDVREWVLPDGPIRIVFAFPPCTHLASSGARWFRQKGLSALIEALQLVESCRRLCEESGAPWMLENPVGVLSTYWRKPDYTFDPCDYGGYLDPAGDAYTKRTCLWTGGGFVMPKPKRVEPVEGSKMHRLPPSKDRGYLRSVTPAGFARAVFEANESVGMDVGPVRVPADY